VGPIDHLTAAEFRIVAERAVGTRAVVVDLEACTDLDSSGVGALIRSIRRIHEAGGRVVVTTSAKSPLALRLRHAGVTRLAPVIAKETAGRAA
jgi:anti-anti-sigma factor